MYLPDAEKNTIFSEGGFLLTCMAMLSNHNYLQGMKVELVGLDCFITPQNLNVNQERR